MIPDPEIHAFLVQHLQAIQENNVERYHATTAEDLSLYEWWVTPHRLDGLPFHDFMMEANRQHGTVFGAEAEAGRLAQTSPAGPGLSRYDLSNLRIQRYDDTAIASYTLLTSTQTGDGVKVAAHNESRVIVRLEGSWKVVHVHKSPAWPAPHLAP